MASYDSVSDDLIIQIFFNFSDMHHKRRRRPRRILQKKEELSEETELSLQTITTRMATTATQTTRRSCIPWAAPLRHLNIDLVLLGLLLSIFSTSYVQGQPPPLPPAGVRS